MKRDSAELKRLAREILTHRYGIPMAMLVITELILTLLLSPFSVDVTVWTSIRELGTYLLATLVVSLLGAVFSVGHIYIGLRMARKQTYSFGDLFYGFRNHPDKYILASLLLTMISLIPVIPLVFVLVGIKLTGGGIGAIILFIVAILIFMVGEIYIAIRYGLILYLLLDIPEMGVLESFRVSSSWMQGNKGRLLYINLSFIGWQILAVLSFGIGSLWIEPYIHQTKVCFYMDVLEEQQGNRQ